MIDTVLQDSDTTISTAVLFQQDDKKAFSQVYDSYSPALFGVISEIVGDAKNAEIILQKTFAEIWSKRKSIDFPKERPFIFMFKIARELAIRSISGKGKRPDMVNQLVNNLVSNPDSINMQEIGNMAFKLIYYTGCTFDEAGDKLNVSGDVLKIMMVNTIKQLREQL
jgi:DNA-directed RNA polymerase specialized sigma24 family protein